VDKCQSDVIVRIIRIISREYNSVSCLAGGGQYTAVGLRAAVIARGDVDNSCNTGVLHDFWRCSQHFVTRQNDVEYIATPSKTGRHCARTVSSRCCT